jgi:hypothetical protein
MVLHGGGWEGVPVDEQQLLAQVLQEPLEPSRQLQEPCPGVRGRRL